jgi:hypothetical protein
MHGTEMPMAAVPLPRRTRGGGSGSLFFITVTARRGSNFLFVVAARQRQMFSRDGHLWHGRLLTSSSDFYIIAKIGLRYYFAFANY